MRQRHPQTPLLSDEFRRSHKIRTPEETYQILADFYTGQFQQGPLHDEWELSYKLDTLRRNQKACEAIRHTAYGLIEDIRRSFRTQWTDPGDYSRVVYTVEDVLTVIFLACICNKNTCVDIAQFYRNHLDELLFILPTLPAPPMMLSHDTIRNVLRFLSIEDAETFFTVNFGQVRTELEKLMHYDPERQQLFRPDKETLYFDGQEPGSSSKKGQPNRKIKAGVIVGLYNNDSQVCEGVTTVDKKNNEGAAFARLLRVANIEDRIVMADALNTTRKNMQLILDHDADYLLPIKKNLGNDVMVKSCRYVFNQAQNKDSDLMLYSKEAGTFKGHGRITQCCVSILDAKKALRGTGLLKEYPGLKTLAHYTAAVFKTNGSKDHKCSTLEMFFLSSLPFGNNDPEITKTLEQVTHSILIRWNQEGLMHAALDNTFRQDEHQMSDPNFVTGCTLVNHAAYNMVSWFRQRLSREEKLKTPMSYARTMSTLEAKMFKLYRWFTDYWMEGINLRDKDKPPKRHRAPKTKA